jgi:elongation factor 2
MAEPVLLEPFQNVYIQVPQDQMGGATSEIQGRRGIILSMDSQGDMIVFKAKMPVAEMFGFAGAIRSATEGRALWSTEFEGFEPLPANLLMETVKQIRTRKGLKPEMPKPSDYLKVV